LAKAAGAAKIILFEKNDLRIGLGKKVGADYAFNIDALAGEGKTPADAVREVTKGVGAAMVVEATHHQQQNIGEIESIVAVGGTIVQIGISPERTSVMSTHLQKKGVNYHCSIGSSGHGIWPNVIRLIAARRIDPSLFLTGTFGLDQAIEAIKTAEKADGGKYVVTPNR
jgi:threonine dehydrogenase-like Zn-dependent dehydrogenase